MILRKIKDNDSVYFLDSKNRIQGELKTYSDGKLKYIETYKDNYFHGKNEIFLESGEVKTEYFFYGKSLGLESEGEKKFNSLIKADTIKERFKVNKKCNFYKKNTL